MNRFRWYHVLMALAVNAAVIVIGVQFYDQTVGSAGRLIESTQQLSEQSRTLALIQQRLMEMSSPVDEVFRTANLADVRRRYERAKESVRAALDDSSMSAGSRRELRDPVNRMMEAGDRVIREYEMSTGLAETDPARPARIVSAAAALGEKNAALHESIRSLELLLARHASQRDDLLHLHERELQSRASYERYFIAGVILILTGVFWYAGRLQQATQALEAERRERLASIGELASSVAHGIRNPLAAIRMSAQLILRRTSADDPLRDRLNDILQECTRLGDRVTGLLGLARATRTVRDVIDLNAIVRETSREVQGRFTEKRMTLKCVESEQPLLIEADRGQIEQVVIELLSNALDHSREGDTVTVECRPVPTRGLAAMIVEDQGPGVAEVIRSRIFDLFFTTKPEGTGIGLATIKRYARLHGGEVFLEPGSASRGARFVVHLPLAGDCGRAGRFPLFGRLTDRLRRWINRSSRVLSGGGPWHEKAA